MFRAAAFVSLLALCAGAVHAEDDGHAYARAQAKLTEQLNARIARGVELATPAPAPARPASDLPPADRRASR